MRIDVANESSVGFGSHDANIIHLQRDETCTVETGVSNQARVGQNDSHMVINRQRTLVYFVEIADLLGRAAAALR